MEKQKTAVVKNAGGSPVLSHEVRGKDGKISDKSQPARTTYLRLYFNMRPNRAVTIDELIDARVAVGSHCRQNTLPDMVADGLAEGWLAVETIGGIEYYSKR